jgi:hypothetical protein
MILLLGSLSRRFLVRDGSAWLEGVETKGRNQTFHGE